MFFCFLSSDFIFCIIIIFDFCCHVLYVHVASFQFFLSVHLVFFVVFVFSFTFSVHLTS